MPLLCENRLPATLDLDTRTPNDLQDPLSWSMEFGTEGLFIYQYSRESEHFVSNFSPQSYCCMQEKKSKTRK